MCCFLIDLFFLDVKFFFSFCCVGVLGVFMVFCFLYEICVVEFFFSCILWVVRLKSIFFLIVLELFKGSWVRKEFLRNDFKGKILVVKVVWRMIVMIVVIVLVEVVVILVVVVVVKRSLIWVVVV